MKEDDIDEHKFVDYNSLYNTHKSSFNTVVKGAVPPTIPSQTQKLKRLIIRSTNFEND